MDSFSLKFLKPANSPSQRLENPQQQITISFMKKLSQQREFNVMFLENVQES